MSEKNNDLSVMKQYVSAHLWTAGDLLAAEPLDDAKRIIVLCDTFSLCFGLSEAKTSEDKKLYDAVQEMRIDLLEYEDAPKQKEKIKSIRKKFYSQKILPQMIAYITKFLQ